MIQIAQYLNIDVIGGNFLMGNDQGGAWEGPAHSVSLPSFKMTKTEVTVAQHRQCVNAGVCSPPKCSNTDIQDGVILCNYTQNRENHPVNYVTWSQFRKFAHWVGARLSTEAQYEFTARSRVQSFYICMGKYPTYMQSR